MNSYSARVYPKPCAKAIRLLTGALEHFPRESFGTDQQHHITWRLPMLKDIGGVVGDRDGHLDGERS
jgi:hypothetical protein